MAANMDIWYENKPELKSELLSLYKFTKGFSVLGFANIVPTLEKINV
jgi:hypothetical protein